MEISPSPFAPDNLISREGFDRPVPCKSSHSAYSPAPAAFPAGVDPNRGSEETVRSPGETVRSPGETVRSPGVL